MSKEDECAICFYKLDKLSKFPKDYPKEWMWCCGCLNVGEMLVEKGIDEMKDIFHISNSTLKRIKEVNKIINVN